jgi:NAD(P)-dependent dehydrogenase (short-subunit alcohol dehydrogenase family)
MDTFRDRVALITGAASGIGRAVALHLAAAGARIAALDVQQAGLEGLAAEMKGTPNAWALCDVTDLAGVRAAVRQLEGQLGPVDVLVASAGIGRETAALGFKAEDANAQIQVNLLGVVNSIDAVLAGMIERRRGHLVVLSSIASYRGFPLMAGYCASKAGVNALLDSLRVELRGSGVAVTTVCPGWVRTPLTESIGLPADVAMMEVGEAARRIVAAMTARRPFLAFPAGTCWQARMMRYLPRPISDWLAHRYLVRAQKWKASSGG